MNGDAGTVQFTDGSRKAFDVVTIKDNGWVFVRDKDAQKSQHIPERRIKAIERDYSESGRTTVPSEVKA